MIAPTREKLRESLRNIQIRFELELQLSKTSGNIMKLALAVIKIESSNLEFFELLGRGSRPHSKVSILLESNSGRLMPPFCRIGSVSGVLGRF